MNIYTFTTIQKFANLCHDKNKYKYRIQLKKKLKIRNSSFKL